MRCNKLFRTFLIAAISNSCAAFAQSGAISSTWEQYMADVRPHLESGQVSMVIDNKFWKKHADMVVEWSGRIKSCAPRSTDKKLVCDVVMTPHTVRVKGGPKNGQVIDTIGVVPLEKEAVRWKTLAGETVKFRAKTLPSVAIFPNKKAGGEPHVAIVVIDAQLMGK